MKISVSRCLGRIFVHKDAKKETAGSGHTLFHIKSTLFMHAHPSQTPAKYFFGYTGDYATKCLNGILPSTLILARVKDEEEADITCSNGLPGVQGGNICCSEACGTCGGSGCSIRNGLTGADCCGGTIKNSRVMCSASGEAPCIVGEGTVCLWLIPNELWSLAIFIFNFNCFIDVRDGPHHNNRLIKHK